MAEMRSPFPGMDPYLESPDVWPDVHTRLMNVFAEQLAPALAPKYLAELNTQLIIDRYDPQASLLETGYALPDVAVTQLREAAVVAEPTLAVRPVRLKVPIAAPTRLVSVYVRLREDAKLVTVIELLSPVNKRPGQGRKDYLDKRESFLSSQVHLVEIDLLRKWPRMPFEGKVPKSDYLAMVSNFYERPNCDVWPISLRQPLPDLSIPLLKPDPPVTLDLNAALRTAHERARYDLRIDYSQPSDPPLSESDAAWAAELIAPLPANADGPGSP
jgi:hypothetical protein